jgi:hypothetical protein
VPTELRRESADLRDKAELEDVRTGAGVRTHEDDEYGLAGEADPKVFLTTSRNPSTRLTAFAKELKLVFPNAVRVNRGALVRGGRLSARCQGLWLTLRARRHTGGLQHGGVLPFQRVHRHCGGPRAQG